jgi:endothelin-converting enzyme
MAENDRSERVPLLDDDDDANAPKEDNSTGARVKRYLRGSGILLGIILLLLVILVPLLVQASRRAPAEHDVPERKPSNNGSELCTSAACVLASANILRSLAPK